MFKLYVGQRTNRRNTNFMRAVTAIHVLIFLARLVTKFLKKSVVTKSVTQNRWWQRHLIVSSIIYWHKNNDNENVGSRELLKMNLNYSITYTFIQIADIVNLIDNRHYYKLCQQCLSYKNIRKSFTDFQYHALFE